VLNFKRFNETFENLKTCKPVVSDVCEKIFLQAFTETSESCKQYGFQLFTNLLEQLEIYFSQDFGKGKSKLKINLQDLNNYDVLKDYEASEIPKSWWETFITSSMSEEEKSKSFEKIVMPTSKGRAEVTSIDYVLNQVFNDSGTKRSWDRSVRVKESGKLMK